MSGYGSRSPDRGDYGGSPYRSRSVSRSPSRSRSPRSRSYSRSPPPKGKGYSRSPSRSPPPRRGRKRSYSRSSSRSRSRSHSRSRRHRRSRSRSHSPYGKKRYNRGRNRSRSPMSNRRRHQGNRVREFNPSPCRVVGVFGLSLYTGEKEIRELFSKYGPIEQVQVVYDHQTGRSRGFAFIYYEDIDDAIDAKERCNGLELDGRKIRVDYSITKRAHTPTPGVYMGKPTRSGYDDRGGGRYDDDDYHDRGRSSRSSRY